jgi:hypothetical protein
MKSIQLASYYLDEVIKYLGYAYGSKVRKVWTCEDSTVAIFVHEEYVFRTSSYQTLTSIVEGDRNAGTFTLTVVGSGGGSGIFNISWGSQNAGENTIIKNVQKIIEQTGQ